MAYLISLRQRPYPRAFDRGFGKLFVQIAVNTLCTVALIRPPLVNVQLNCKKYPLESGTVLATRKVMEVTLPPLRYGTLLLPMRLF